MADSGRYVESRRWVLAGVVLLIGAVLLAGGIYLAGIGGTLYYSIAGLTVIGSACYTVRGRRGRPAVLVIVENSLHRAAFREAHRRRS